MSISEYDPQSRNMVNNMTFELWQCPASAADAAAQAAYFGFLSVAPALHATAPSMTVQ